MLARRPCHRSGRGRRRAHRGAGGRRAARRRRGGGGLTEALADAGLRVVAVETDSRLYGLVRERFARRPEVACHHADFLTFPLPATPYCVVSNVPYAITAALVRRLLHAARPPDEALLIVQREAAEKFAG